MTSNNVSVRRLGAKWRMLHQLIYPASRLFLVHHLWQVRADYYEFVLFLCGFSLLFAERLWRRARRWSSEIAPEPRPQWLIFVKWNSLFSEGLGRWWLGPFTQAPIALKFF